MDPTQIKAFIDAMAASDLAEMEVGHDGWTLRLVRRPGATAPAVPPAVKRPATPAAAPRAGVPAAAAVSKELLAPLFGVLHLQSAPGAAPFVSVGEPVRAGQTLAVIEAMKVFNEVLAEADGIVDALLVASGTEVEAGQPLLRFR